MGIGGGDGGMATRSTIIEEWTERAIFGNTALRPSGTAVGGQQPKVD